MSKQKHYEIAIGVFVISAVVSIIGMILAFQGGAGIFTSTFTVKIRFNHIGDLLPGAPVKLGGVRIGTVESLALLPSGSIEALAEIYDDPNIVLREGTTAFIQTSGLVGDTFVEFSVGKGEKLFSRNGADVVDGQGQVTTTELLQQVKQIGEKVTSLVDNVNDIIGSDQFKQDIRDTVHNTSNIARQANRFLTDLTRTSDNIFKASEDIRKTSSTVRTMAAEVRASVLSPENIQAIDETVSNIRDISRDGVAMGKHAAALLERGDTLLVEEEPHLRAAFRDIAAVANDIRVKVAAIRTDQGIFRYFTTDELTGKIEDLLNTVRRPIGDLARLFENVSRLDILSDYNLGGRLADRRLQELERKGVTKARDIRDAEFNAEQESRQARNEGPWKERLEEYRKWESIQKHYDR